MRMPGWRGGSPCHPARSFARRLWLVLLLAIAAPLPSRAGEPPQTPFLRIEAGGHIGSVPRLAVDASGRLMASASYDKTVRLWSMPDGTPRAVLRPPIGNGQEGEMYAVALSPDGRRVFAAGATGGTWDGTFSIYIFDTEKATLAGLLPGLPAPVNDLAVSPDGTRFAAGLAQGGVRVWEAGNGHPIFEDRAYAGPVRAVAFDARNRLFATAADGHVRAYDADGRKRADVQPQPGLRPWGLAVSPDGDLLAVTYENADRQGRLHIDVLNAATLTRAYAPDTSNLHGEGLLATTWMSGANGGVQLLAGGYARGEGGNVIRRWGDFGLGTATDLPAARDTILDLVRIPGGGAVFSAEDPGWGRIGADGAIAQRPRPPLADLRPARDRLAVSMDGTRVEFATGTGTLRFDVAARSLSLATAPDAALGAARTSAPGLTVTSWRDTDGPRLNGQPLALDRGEISRSLAFLPDNSGLILGTDTALRLYGRDGRQIASVYIPAAAWAVGVSGDGRVAVAALLDGTVRWYGLDKAAPLAERAALFAHADAQRWLLFTPEGFFDDADRGGDTFVGVHLNRAHNQQPEWISFSQAYRALYAPAVVRARLEGDPAPAKASLAELGDLRQRLARQPVVQVADACVPQADGTCLKLDLRPGRTPTLPTGATSLRLSLKVADRGLGIGPVDVFVNERNAGRHAPPAAETPTTVDVPLDPGNDTVQARVYDGTGTIFSETAPLQIEGAADASNGSGRLFVLAIGVDQYAAPDLALHYAVADARTFTDVIRKAATPLYSNVDITLLTNQEATRAGILSAFYRLSRQVNSRDTFLFYVASHGARSQTDGRFLLIPQDDSDLSSWATITRGAIDETTLIAALSRIRAKDALLFLDTCYSGEVTADSLANVGHETGRYLLAASSSAQEALDSFDNRNGVFVYAIREALSGQAAMDADNTVSALSLGEYVSRRVGQLARKKGHEQDAQFKTAQRELRSFPIGKVVH